MKSLRVAIALSLANLGLLVWQVARILPVEASGAAPVLRGRQLEIVDEQGRIRASIKLHPEDKAGAYPETVMLRLIDAEGRPEVKIGASQKGGGIGLVGESDDTQVLLKAEGEGSLVRLAEKNGRSKVIQP